MADAIVMPEQPVDVVPGAAVLDRDVVVVLNTFESHLFRVLSVLLAVLRIELSDFTILTRTQRDAEYNCTDGTQQNEQDRERTTPRSIFEAVESSGHQWTGEDDQGNCQTGECDPRLQVEWQVARDYTLVLHVFELLHLRYLRQARKITEKRVQIFFVLSVQCFVTAVGELILVETARRYHVRQVIGEPLLEIVARAHLVQDLRLGYRFNCTLDRLGCLDLVLLLKVDVRVQVIHDILFVEVSRCTYGVTLAPNEHVLGHSESPTHHANAPMKIPEIGSTMARKTR